jgi:hypothetical protein
MAQNKDVAVGILALMYSTQHQFAAMAAEEQFLDINNSILY